MFCFSSLVPLLCTFARSVTVYNQLWNWIDHHCPVGMGALNCQACFDYSGACFCFSVFLFFCVSLLALLYELGPSQFVCDLIFTEPHFLVTYCSHVLFCG